MLGVVGDVVEDVVVWHDGTYRYGTDNPSAIVRSRGGSAANVAVIAAARVPTRFIGCVGDDLTGERLVQELRACGIDVRTQSRGRTGTIVVVVDHTGERTMFPDRGAAAQLRTVCTEWLHAVDILHLPSYCFSAEPTAQATRDLVRVAHSRRIEVSVDTSSTALIEQYGPARYRALLDELQPDILFANAREAALLGAGLGHLAAAVIVKNGAGPAAVHLSGQPPALVPARFVADVRDTTGAGDAFAAGFLAARLNGSDPLAAAAAGHDAARHVLLSPGAAARAPTEPRPERLR